MEEVTRTARGTAKVKTSGTSLTIPSFSVPQGHSLVVSLGYDNSQGEPISVEHAGRTLRRRIKRDNTANGFEASMWVKGEYHKEQTGAVVITWAAAIGKRVAAASSFDIALKTDDKSGATPANTANPGTGQTGADVNAGSFVTDTWYEITVVGTTDFTAIGAASNTVGVVFRATGAGSGTGVAREALDSEQTMALCCFVSEGPSSDHASATAQIEDQNTLQAATIGQQDGTVGAPPTSNITVVEAFLQLTGQETTAGQLSNATLRNWAALILVLEERYSWNEQGVTPADITEVEVIVDAAGGNVDNIYYGFDEESGLWMAYETTDPGTLRAIGYFTGWQAP